MKKYFVLLVFVFNNWNLFAQAYKPKIFSSGVDFSRQSLTEADFSNAVISKEAWFLYVKFSNTANFSNAQFLGKAHFSGAGFINGADFVNTQFLDQALFSGTTFINGADFDNAKFSKKAYFQDSNFSEYTDFDDVKFSNGADFTAARFSKNTDFSRAVFAPKNILKLTNVFSKDSTDFIFFQTIFPDTILFEDNDNIKHEVNFTNANFTDSTRYDRKSKLNRPILISLSGSNIAKLHLDYLHFKLFLPRSIIDENASVYEAMLNNFKTNGQTESYQLLDIEYQEFKWHNSLWTRYLVWIPEYWWNFGYDKELVFLWTFVFLVIFTSLSYFFIYDLNTKVYPVDKIPAFTYWEPKLSVKKFWQRLWFSLMYTSIIFFKLSLDIKKLEFKKLGAPFI